GHDGSVLLSQNFVRREIAGVMVGAPEERNLSWLDYSWPLDLSADGRRLLFSEGGSGRGTSGDMYLGSTERPAPVKIGTADLFGRLSHNGAWVLAETSSARGYECRLVPTGAGDERPLTLPGLALSLPFAWLPESRHVVVNASAPGRPQRAYVVDVDSGALRP